MSIKSKLEEAAQRLSKALEGAEDTGAVDLQRIIGGAIADCRAALALADPGKAWLEETGHAWGNYTATIRDRMTHRFAAKIAAGELRKYADRCGITDRPEITKQIADLDAIAEGGGE